MNKWILALCLLAGGAALHAQPFNPTVQAGPTLPATCTPGSIFPAWFLLTAAGPVASPYYCSATNTWTASGSGGGGSGTGAVYVGVLSGIPATCTVGQYAIITDATVGMGLYFCTATNTWTQQWTPIAGTCVLLSFNPTTAAETYSIDPNCMLSSPAPGAAPNLNTNGTQRYAIAVCTTTCTVSVPVPAHDFQFCVMNDDNVSTVITLSAIGSSARYENTARTAYGTAGTGTFVSAGAVGDMVCIYGRDATHYLTTAFTGTWVAN